MPRIDRAGIVARVPHAGRMCLLDSVESWDSVAIHCRSRRHRPMVDDRPHPLAREGRMPATAAIEFAAQAMAVHGALLGEAAESAHANAAARPVAPGMLAAVRSVTLAGRWIPHGTDALDIRAHRVAGDTLQVIYEFEVSADGPVAHGRAVVLLRAPQETATQDTPSA